MTLMEFTLRIAMAIFMGFIIGIERQLTGNPAGIRTNILVSLGSCMFVLFSQVMDADAPDKTRIAAQVVTGVGFLCGGVIFKEGMNVRGLSTAATIWCTAAIGVLTSSGMLKYASAATVLVVIVNIFFRFLSDKITPLAQDIESEWYYKVSITCTGHKEMMIRSIIMTYITSTKLTLSNLDSREIAEDKVEIAAKMVCYGKRRDEVAENLIGIISSEQHVTSAGWELL